MCVPMYVLPDDDNLCVFRCMFGRLRVVDLWAGLSLRLDFYLPVGGVDLWGGSTYGREYTVTVYADDNKANSTTEWRAT